MNLSTISAHLNSLNADVSIYRSVYSYTDDDKRWSCTIVITNASTEIKVRGDGPSAEPAILSAYKALTALLDANQVKAALNIPALTFDAQAISPAANTLDEGSTL